MPKISITIDDVTQSTEVSDETLAIIKESAKIFDLPEIYFLFETIRNYNGELNEMNILRFINRAIDDEMPEGEV